ncbi:MAG TPA: ComEA family DNA-binding protein [Ktedonobacteraceae bacterium]|nr:ComEA family DNA-binding protein [Ktedonobacteraceae bacterium]
MAISPQQPENKAHGLLKQYITTQTTVSIPAVRPDLPSTTPLTPIESTNGEEAGTPRKKLRHIPLLVIAFSVLLALLLFFTWHSFSQQTPPETISPQTFTTTSAKNTASPVANIPATENNGATIQVYIVGAVKHPGVYTLPATARVYQLIQAAGGPQANANLVAINLAAKLSDGQEIYVAVIGEPPPMTIGGSAATTSSATSTNPLVNINTASADDLRQNLHIASTTAQSIISYRQEHGNFTAIDQLLQAVSKSIYDKIKDQVTLS